MKVGEEGCLILERSLKSLVGVRDGPHLGGWKGTVEASGLDFYQLGVSSLVSK